MTVKRLLKMIFGRLTAVFAAIALQIIFMVYVVFRLDAEYQVASTLIQFAVVIIIFWILNDWMDPAYKLLWSILILTVPVIGLVLYYLMGRSRMTRQVRKRYEEAVRICLPLMQRKDSDVLLKKLREEDPDAARQSRYLSQDMDFPVYRNTETVFFPTGEELFKRLKEELKKAQHFIFIEYFIVAEGQMWDEMLEILEEKVKAGVDVRLIYDDIGSIGTLPMGYFRKMRERGIKCVVFNRFVPAVSIFLNNRDHRKILVIDGHTAFTGGINFADEYINRITRFGYWKDNGIMLHGEGAFSFTVMFLQMWGVITKSDRELREIARFAEPKDSLLEKRAPFSTRLYHKEQFSGEGYVQPYCDTPLDKETVGENVYLNLISQAHDYVWIYTPYLIIDSEMMSALTIAAKSGVDVRIVTPGIPDKKIAYLLTRSCYGQLIDSGVKIYEYSPGFIHAKTVISDDKIATVGSVNFDYRSLYLHFECGVWMYRTSAVMQIKKDCEETLAKCRKITEDWLKKQNIFVRLSAAVLKPLAPLL